MAVAAEVLTESPQRLVLGVEGGDTPGLRLVQNDQILSPLAMVRMREDGRLSAPQHILSSGDKDKDKESYWQSPRQLKIVGGFVVRQELETPEGMNAREEAFLDFATGVQENLATDKQHGERLSFEPMREMKIIGNHVVNKNGEPVVGLVKRGWEQSSKLAEEDEVYHVQATRDEGDFMVAKIVDNLEVGEMYALVSMDPKEAMAKYGKEFWESVMHYEEDMAVVQVYYRKDKDTLLAGAYSVKQSDKKAFAKILQSHGRTIDPGTHSDYWSRYGIRKNVSLEEAQAFGIEMREAHRREIGEITSLLSVTELMKTHSSLVHTYFDTYIIPLAEAMVTERNNETMQGLAQTLLGQAQVFKPEVVRNLIKISNSKSFNDEDGFFMEEMVRYALVEDLRKYVEARLQGSSEGGEQAVPEPININPQALHARVAQNVVTGTVAGRSYNGCTSAGGMGIKNDPNTRMPGSDVPDGPQDIFGGKSGDRDKDAEQGDCEFVSTQCPNCDAKKVKTKVTIKIIDGKKQKHVSGSCGCSKVYSLS